MFIDNAIQSSCFSKVCRHQPLGLVLPCQDLSFPRLSLDSSGYAPIEGWDFKEIYNIKQFPLVAI